MADSIRAKTKFLATGLTVAAMSVTACQGAPKGPRDWVTSPLDANRVSVERKTELLEIDLPASRTALLEKDRKTISAFIDRYASVGEGDLIVTSPVGAANGQLALQSLADVRAIAYARGLEYDSIRVRTYDASAVSAAPMVIGFERYEAIAPDCPLLSQVDMSDISNNAELPIFGCAVNTNLAAMIANPSDLAGDRPLAPADTTLTASKTDKYQAGESTASDSSVDASIQ